MPDEQEEKIELRSEEVQELMGQIPPWILRWGISLVGVILLGVLAGSCFFKYPETLTAEITVTTETPPVELYTLATGKLERVMMVNQQQVEAGQVLAVVESTADFMDVAFVDESINQWKQGKKNDRELLRLLQERPMLLGDMQGAFATFITALTDAIHHRSENYYPQKIGLKDQQRLQRRRLEQDKGREQALHRKQADIVAKMYQRDSTLYRMKLISEEEYNSAEQTFLQSRQTTVSDQSARTQMQMERLQDSETMLDLQRQYWQTESEVELKLSSSVEQLQNDIRQYEKAYVLKTPVAGSVNMMGSWKQNQFVEAGTLMTIIIPSEKPISVGRAKLPAAGAGKVKVGQVVKVRLTNFPDAEYGYVKGFVASVSAIPDKESNYFLEISFPDGLQTNYNRELPQARQLMGTAEIVVKDKRLIKNLVQPIEKLLKE